MEEERILRRIPLEIAVLSFIIALFSLLFFSPLTALFIIAGGAFSAVSFIWLKQNLSKLILLKNGGSPSLENAKKGTEEEEKGTGNFFRKKSSLSPFLPPSFKKAILSTLLFYSLRLVLILAIFFIIIFFFSKNIIAFIVGFSTVVPVFMVEAVSMLIRLNKWKS